MDTTAGAVAIELRKLAEVLDAEPTAIIQRPYVSFSHRYASGAKDKFLRMAKLMPRPIKKGDGYSHDEVTLDYTTDAIDLRVSIDKNSMCVLVTPAQAAVYECEPILSQLEEASL